jgi:hypothetical protein
MAERPTRDQVLDRAVLVFMDILREMRTTPTDEHEGEV